MLEGLNTGHDESLSTVAIRIHDTFSPSAVIV